MADEDKEIIPIVPAKKIGGCACGSKGCSTDKKSVV